MIRRNFFVFSQAGEAVAGNLKTGKRIWAQRVHDAILGTPVVSGSAILLVTQDGYVYSIHKDNGSVQWQVRLEDRFIAPLSILNGTLLLPSETGVLYALSEKNGSEFWRFSGQDKFNSRAIVSGNNIFIGGWRRQFLCLNSEGKVNWKFNTPEIVAEDAMILRNLIFFPCYDQFVYALDAQTGKLVWRYPADRPSNLVLLHEKSTTKEEIVFASDRDLIYLSAPSGRTVRRIKFQKVPSRLYVSDDRLYVISGNLYSINHVKASTSVVFTARNPIFKVTFGSGMTLALDELYSIYGYASNRDFPD